MGPSVTSASTGAWFVLAPDPDDDPAAALAAALGRIRRRGQSLVLVRSLVGRCLEGARRAEAAHGDVAAALLTGVLDSIGAASEPSSSEPDPCAGIDLLSHVAAGAAAYGEEGPETAGAFLARMIGAIEGIEAQSGDPATRAALVAAAVLADLGGGPRGPFRFDVYGNALVDEIVGAAPFDACALETLRMVVAANAAFTRAVAADYAEDEATARSEFDTARGLFSTAGLPVESAICLRHLASLTWQAHPDQALSDFVDARSVLVEFGRDVEVALTDLQAALLVAEHVDVSAARDMVNDARDVFVENSMTLEAATCEAVLAALAKVEGRRLLAAVHFDTAAGLFEDDGDTDKARDCRDQARQVIGRGSESPPGSDASPQ